MKIRARMELQEKRKVLMTNMDKRSLLVERIKENLKLNKGQANREKHLKEEKLIEDRQELIELTKQVLSLFNNNKETRR